MKNDRLMINSRHLGWPVLLFIAMLMAACAPAPFETLPGDPIAEAAEAAKLEICLSEPLLINAPGATGGTSYVIAHDCEPAEPAYQVVIIAEAFGDEEARDAAIRNYLHTTVGRTAQKYGLLTIGNLVITPIGERDDTVYALLDRHLRSMGAR